MYIYIPLIYKPFFFFFFFDILSLTGIKICGFLREYKTKDNEMYGL